MPKTAKIRKDTKASQLALTAANVPGQPSCFGYFSAAAKAPKPVLPSRPDRDPFLASAPVPSAFALPPPPQLTAKASTTTLSPQPSRSTKQHSSHPITPKRSITRSPQGSARKSFKDADGRRQDKYPIGRGTSSSPIVLTTSSPTMLPAHQSPLPLCPIDDNVGTAHTASTPTRSARYLPPPPLSITPKNSPPLLTPSDTHSSKDSFDSPFLVTPSIDPPRVSTGATPALAQVHLSEDGAHSKDVTAGPPQDVTMEDGPSVFGAEKAQNDGDQHLKELLFAIDNCLELAEQALPSTDPQAVQASGRADQIFVRTLLGRSTSLFPESSGRLMANLESRPNSKQKRSYKDWEQYMYRFTAGGAS